jgi:hypothetical protein
LVVFRGAFGLAYFPGNQQSGSFMKNAPFIGAYGPVLSGGTTGGQPTVFLSNGLPTPIATDYLNPSGAVTAVDQNFKSTRVQQFNLTVEKAFAGNVIGAAYVGSRGDRVAQGAGGAGPDINLAPVGPGSVQSRRAYASLAPGLTGITMLESAYNSYYNAMQVTFQRRYRGGFSFNSNYTLAHNEWTASAPWDVSRIERRRGQRRAIASRSRRTTSCRSAGRYRRDGPGAGNWQVNALVAWQTGLPFNITNARLGRIPAEPIVRTRR